MSNDFQEQDAIRYFLGELSENELTAFEERFFTDAEFSDWLDEVETDLIDSYVRGELDAAQNQRFEQNFLVSERRQSRVKAAVALLEKEKSFAPSAAIAENPKPSFWESLRGFFTVPNLAYTSFGILLLAVIGGIVLFFQRPPEIVKIGNENLRIEPTKQTSPPNSPEKSPTQTPSEAPQNINSQTDEPIKKPSPEKQKEEPKNETPKEVRQDSPVLAQFGLTSSSLRNGGNEPTKINLKAGTERVYLRLRFKTEEEFVKYRIELRDANGNLISSQNLKNKNALGITVPAKKLRKGSYKVTLKGAKTDLEFEDLDFYDFSVEKK